MICNTCVRLTVIQSERGESMWDEIYQAYYPELFRYAVHACGNVTDGEDLAQETFMKALQSAGVFEDLGPSQKRAWLYRALKNLIYDRYRRAQVENAYLEIIEEDAYILDAGIQQTENELLLAKLSDEDRALFHLRYFENYNAPELAEMFGLPTGTIRSRLSRARKLLKEMLESGGNENG